MSSDGARMSVRFTDPHGEVTDWIADRSPQTLRPHGQTAPDPANETPDAL